MKGNFLQTKDMYVTRVGADRPETPGSYGPKGAWK